MRLVALTALTMVAFAANSVLNRMAVANFATDPAAFAVVRTVAGAAMLVVLVRLRRGAAFDWSPPARILGGASLALYLAGFSMAYRSLDAGIGALILFGGVQVTMFVGAIIGRESVPVRRWVGAAISVAGLGWLVWPQGGAVSAVPLHGTLLMGAAALGWGVYSLAGRSASDPLASTAANFVTAVPLVAPLLLLGAAVTPAGAALAVVAGALTSGLGYALWCAVMPRLGATRAAVAQLSVPVIAGLGGAVLLAELPDARALLGGAAVLLGIAVSLIPRRT